MVLDIRFDREVTQGSLIKDTRPRGKVAENPVVNQGLACSSKLGESREYRVKPLAYSIRLVGCLYHYVRDIEGRYGMYKPDSLSFGFRWLYTLPTCSRIHGFIYFHTTSNQSRRHTAQDQSLHC